MNSYFRDFIRNLLGVTSLMVMLTACVPTTAPTPEIVVQLPVPTPTLEPTFTPLPSPTDTSTPSPMATAEPTPTPLPEASLSGRILDQETGQPIAKAKVSAGTSTATTDADGRYSLTGLAPGQYVLSTTHEGYDPAISAIFTLAAGQELSLDLALYAPDASPYPQDPMLTNPLDPIGAPTKEDAERLARLQGLTDKVVSIEETKLRGEFLVNYKIGDDIRAAVAELNHEVWELTDETGRQWWIIKVCGNLASLLPARVPIPTPEPRPLPPLAEVVVDKVSLRACASEECAEEGTIERGAQVEVFGCLADGGWCEVGWSGGRGWCTGRSLRQLAVAEAVPVVEAVLPTATPRTVAVGAGKIAFLSTRDLSPNNYELYLMNPDGSQQTRITTTGLSQSPCFLSWTSRDNQLLYLLCSSFGRIVNLSDGVPHPWRLPDFGNGMSMSLSPDGSKLAYVKPNGSTWNIFVINADGTNPRQLTSYSENVRANRPSWSPRGNKLAFSVWGADTDRSFWVMNVDGSEKVKLADVASLSSTWSPDGNRIAFECWTETGRPDLDLCIINSDGTNLVNLTHLGDQEQPREAWNPTWSPDGTRIAFQLNSSANPITPSQIHFINADGTNLTQLTFEGNNCCPAWSY
jgi:TolB protein